MYHSPRLCPKEYRFHLLAHIAYRWNLPHHTPLQNLHSPAFFATPMLFQASHPCLLEDRRLAVLEQYPVENPAVYDPLWFDKHTPELRRRGGLYRNWVQLHAG